MIDSDVAVLDKTTLRQVEQILDAHTRERVPVTRWTAFSWSVSRHNMFQRCKRAYYLTYYGARRVREANNKVVSAVWWLKQLTSHDAWVGQVLHDIAARGVRAYLEGTAPDEQRLTQQALELYESGLGAARRKVRLDKRWLLLREVFYGEAWQPAYDKIAALIGILFNSEAYQSVLALSPAAILEVDEPFQSFDYVTQGDTVPVYAIPDVLYRAGEAIHIIDWKTGSVVHNEVMSQAQVYQVYAHQAYGVDESGLYIHAIGLGGEPVHITLQPTLEGGYTLIDSSIASMVAHMADESYHTVSIHRFPMTDNLSTCTTCPFKRVCWRHE